MTAVFEIRPKAKTYIFLGDPQRVRPHVHLTVVGEHGIGSVCSQQVAFGLAEVLLIESGACSFDEHIDGQIGEVSLRELNS